MITNQYTTVWMRAMRDLLVQLAGILALAVSIAHGVLGETKVFSRARIEPERLRSLYGVSAMQHGRVDQSCGSPYRHA